MEAGPCIAFGLSSNFTIFTSCCRDRFHCYLGSALTPFSAVSATTKGRELDLLKARYNTREHWEANQTPSPVWNASFLTRGEGQLWTCCFSRSTNTLGQLSAVSQPLQDISFHMEQGPHNGERWGTVPLYVELEIGVTVWLLRHSL